jgi:hypothetical protein
MPRHREQDTTEAPLSLGAAHLNPRDAYRDVPILKSPVWNNEIAAYFFLAGSRQGRL